MQHSHSHKHHHKSPRDYPINENDRNLIKATWKVAKKNGNIAPKAFIRLFKLKPEKQQLFPAFADVDLADLPTNNEFLNQAFTCLAGLNAYIETLGSNPKSCPYLNSERFQSVKGEDIQSFGAILTATMEEELGDAFSAEARTAWKGALNSCADALRKH